MKEDLIKYIEKEIMDIYKHIVYNPNLAKIEAIIEDAQEESKEWCFERAQPITEYEWVAIFRMWKS